MKRLPFWATIFTICGVLILCALGTWQLKRLAWKSNLIGQIEREFAKDPMTVELAPGVLLQGQMQGVFFIRGFLEGIYLHDKEIFVGPRTFEGKTGYHVITPFESFMSDDTMLVNRGWIPEDLPRHEINRPAHSMIITGTAAKVKTPNSFVPPNNPANDEWYSVNLHDLRQAKGLDNLMPFILYADPGRASWPVAEAIKWNPHNNHLQYAVFWFAMAGILALMYYLRFIRGQF